jgi:hypothetical protein
MKGRTYIYMNEQIRRAKPERPVIVAQQGNVLTEGNRVDLYYRGVLVVSVIYEPGGCPSPEYEVKAFVQTDKCEVRVA